MAQAGYDAKIYDDAAVAATTVYSKRYSMRKGSLMSLHIEWSGTPTGTFTLWESNKPDPDPSSDADWVENADIVPAAPSGSAGKQLITLGNAAAKFYRVKYVGASGTGVVNCWIFGGKGA